MADLLDTIDASLDEIEEQVLAELQRLRKASGGERHGEMDPGIKSVLAEVVEDLKRRLQRNGDEQVLELVTERHEVLYARIDVLEQLFGARIPVAVLEAAHKGIQERRRSLEELVVRQRAQRDASHPAAAGVGLFDREPSEQHQIRNHINVTYEEESSLSVTGVYQDNGLYSASRELAVIANLIRGGTIDETPEQAEERRGRAIFEAKDLSSTTPPVTPKPRPDPEPEPEPEKPGIAQTPEEIRRKLAERQGGSTGKAVFGARELSSGPPPEPPQPRVEKKPEPPKASDTSKGGKATFLAKDIEPAAPQEFRPSRKQLEAEKKKEEEERRAGPARFEARDVSSDPFPKKD
jgi:hypothetical protein